MSWEMVKLGKITKNLDSRRKPLNESERTIISQNKLYPYIGANNIMGFVDEFLFNENIICIAEDGGSWGKNEVCAKHYNEKCWVNNHAHVLGDNGESDLKFLMYYLNFSDLNKFITGSTRGKLTKTALESIQIPLPPLSTQKRIAEILDKADALRKADQQLLKYYDQLAQSLFIKLFGDPVKNEKGWEVVSLNELIQNGPQNGLYKNEKDYGLGIPILRIDSFYKGVVYNIDSLKRVNASEKETKMFQIYENDIVINRVNSRSHLGKCALIPNLKEPTLFESNMMRFEVNQQIVNPIFLVRILIQPFMKNQILSRAKDSINQSSINQQDVKSFTLPLPPIEIQNQFATQIQNIEQQKETLKVQIQASEHLFQSLLKQAFNGGLN